MINIYPMSLKHLSRVMQIERESFSDPWSLTSFISELSDNTYATYFIAIYQNRIVGYIGGWLVTDELHITNLAVDKKYRGLGIGQQLIDEIIKYSKNRGINRATLEVRASNNTAMNLYRKKGFTSVGYRPNYYTNNSEDAMIMWKEIKGEGEVEDGE